MLLFYTMSYLHIAVGLLIGIIVGYSIGCLYNVMNMKKGEYILNFVFLGIFGAFFFDLFFSFTVNNNFLPNFFYFRPMIVLEQIAGAIIFPIIVYKPFIEFKPPRFKTKKDDE